MILKSYIVEQNIDLLKNYKATLIYGENNGIKDDVKEEIKNGNQSNEIITFFEEDLLKENVLYKNITTQSLFNEKKVIFVQEATDKIFHQVEECLEKENKKIQIYIFANNLEKKSKLRVYFEKEKTLAIFPCYEDNERTLITYINKKLKDYKGLTGEITNLIINNSNMDRKVIKEELEKIKIYFSNNKISKKEVLEILNIKNDSSFDLIRDKALLGDKNKINKLLCETEILNDESFFYLNNLNYRILRLHEIMKITGNQNNYEQTIDKMRPPIFWKDRPVVIQQLKKWNQKKLEDVIIKIGETEILMKKNSYLKNETIIKDLIINLTNKASSSS